MTIFSSLQPIKCFKTQCILRVFLFVQNHSYQWEVCSIKFELCSNDWWLEKYTDCHLNRLCRKVSDTNSLHNNLEPGLYAFAFMVWIIIFVTNDSVAAETLLLKNKSIGVIFSPSKKPKSFAQYIFMQLKKASCSKYISNLKFVNWFNKLNFHIIRISGNYFVVKALKS